MEIKSLVRKEFLSFEDENPITEMVSKLKLSGKRTGLVFRKGKFMGIIDRRLLLKSSISASDSKIIKCTVRSPTINVSTDIMQAAKIMFNSNLRFLPVEEDNHIIGVLSSLDLIKAAVKLPEVKKLRVQDVKFSKPSPLDENAKLSTAISIMSKEKVDHMLIFEGRKLVGVLSIGDLMDYFVYKKNRISGSKNQGGRTKAATVDRNKVSSLPVKSFTTKNIRTVKRMDLLSRSVATMHLANVRDLVVEEAGKVYGLLTVKRILEKLASLDSSSGSSVKLVGLSKTHLSQTEIDLLKKVANNEISKIERKIKNDLKLNIRIKEHKKSGKSNKKHKYSVTLKVDFPGQILTSTQEDWDPVTALRKSFNNIKNKLNSRYKSESSKGSRKRR